MLEGFGGPLKAEYCVASEAFGYALQVSGVGWGSRAAFQGFVARVVWHSHVVVRDIYGLVRHLRVVVQALCGALWGIVCPSGLRLLWRSVKLYSTPLHRWAPLFLPLHQNDNWLSAIEDFYIPSASNQSHIHTGCFIQGAQYCIPGREAKGNGCFSCCGSPPFILDLDRGLQAWTSSCTCRRNANGRGRVPERTNGRQLGTDGWQRARTSGNGQGLKPTWRRRVITSVDG